MKMATAASVDCSSHTFITALAESGEASNETIRQIAGHVSKQMIRHHSHIGMEAKRRAVDSLVKKASAVRLVSAPLREQARQQPFRTRIIGNNVC